MKGSGTPVRGMIFTMDPKLTSVCMPKKAKIHPAKSLPNLSGAFSAILKIYISNTTKAPIKRMLPMNPISSPTIANIESV